MTATGPIFNRHSRQQPRRSFGKRATTLTELAIVMAVVGSLIGAIWVVSDNLRQKQLAVKASNEILTIVGNLRTLYGGTRSIQATGLTDVTGTVIKNGMIPPEMVTAGNDATIQSPWGSPAVVQTYKDYNAAVVGFQQLSRAACNRLVATSFANTDGLAVAWINGNMLSFPPYGTDAIPNFLTIDTICADGHSNTVSIGYNLN